MIWGKWIALKWQFTDKGRKKHDEQERGKIERSREGGINKEW